MDANTTHKEELLAVLDDNGSIVKGESVSRTEAHDNGILHGASHIFIYRLSESGNIEFLLQKRSPNKDSYPGCLDISSAGHIEYGMDFLDTALKELHEELGLEVNADELYEAFSQHFHKIDEFHGEIFDNREINKIYLLKKDVDITKCVLQKEEVSEVLWLDSEEIRVGINSGAGEICIDAEEFDRVLSFVKKRESLD